MTIVPDRAGFFLGKPDLYDEYVRQEQEAGRYEFNPQFCPRHWKPCPVEGKNGLLASVMLHHIALDEILPSELLRGPVGEIKEWMRSQSEPTCCKLGDERMAALWAEC